MRRTISNLCKCLCLSLIVLLAQMGLAQSIENNPWTGQAQCQVNFQIAGYAHQEIQTWTVTGPQLPNQKDVYPGTWSVVSQGATRRAVGPQNLAAQWNSNVAPMSALLRIGVRPSDNRLLIKSFHAQMVSRAATQGVRQVAAAGAAPAKSSIASDAYEWQFPLIEDSGTATNVTGTGTIPIAWTYMPLAPSGSNGVANCTWHFTKGGESLADGAGITKGRGASADRGGSAGQGGGAASGGGAGAAGGAGAGASASAGGAASGGKAGTGGAASGGSAGAAGGAGAGASASAGGAASGGKTGAGGGASGGSAGAAGGAGAGASASAGGAASGGKTGAGGGASGGSAGAAGGAGAGASASAGGAASSGTAGASTQGSSAGGATGAGAQSGSAGGAAGAGAGGISATQTALPSSTKPLSFVQNLTQINPNQVSQGQQNVSVTLTGKNTSFAQGKTTADFGPGITVTSLTVTSPTTASALVNVDHAATAGFRIITLITGINRAQGDVPNSSSTNETPNGFYVSKVAPTLLTANPSKVAQGQQGMSIALTGRNTSFSQGATTANFGTGITVTSLTVTSPTTATAVINVDPSTPIGSVHVGLTTGNENALLGPTSAGSTAPATGFTVTQPRAWLTNFVPDNVSEGQQGISVALTGYATSFRQGVTTADFGPGITVTSLTVSSNTSATAVINIDRSVPIGGINVTLTTGTENALIPSHNEIPSTIGFSVTRPHPYLIRFDPSSVSQGQQGVSIALTGDATSFQQGVTTANFGPGITVTSLTVSSNTSATAVINVDQSVPVEIVDVTLTTGTETARRPSAALSIAQGQPFSVTRPHPYLTKFDPSSVSQGQQGMSIALTGDATSFQQGVTAADFGPGIAVTSLTVSSNTSATAVINVDRAVPIGGVNVTLTTGAENAHVPSPQESTVQVQGFSVTRPRPLLVKAEPNTVAQGQTGVSIVLTGDATSFQQGVTTAEFGPGITVTSLTVNSNTSATAVINVDPSAPVSIRDIQVTTGSELATMGNAFTLGLRPSTFQVTKP